MARKITENRATDKSSALLNKSEYMTINELAALLHIGRSVATKLIHTDGFPMTKIGKHYRINIAEFRKWQEKNIGKTIEIPKG